MYRARKTVLSIAEKHNEKFAGDISKQLKGWNYIKFPNYRIIVTKADKVNNEITIRCEQKRTKTEIQDYLEQVHNMTVVDIHTSNYDGKVKRKMIPKNQYTSQRRLIQYKEPKYKKAIVKIAPESIKGL